jgi:hypothetical protein
VKNYLTLGPLRVRFSTRHLAPWGYEMVGIGGLSLLSRYNNGDLMLASYMPRNSTWHWAVGITKSGSNRKWIRRSSRRQGQWHDYYRLPFNRELIVSRQDFHLVRRVNP